MVAGDPERLRRRLFSHADDVLYMSGERHLPDRLGGDLGRLEGRRLRKSLGGHVEQSGDDIHIIVSGDIATVGLVAHATVNAPDGKTQELRVRQTHVFRKEDGVWKMIVHHADNIPVWTEIVGGK